MALPGGSRFHVGLERWERVYFHVCVYKVASLIFFPSYLSSLGIETTQNGTNLTSNCLISVKPELDRPKDKFSVFDVISLSYSSWEHTLQNIPSAGLFHLE